jgi:putative CocE/NonD family hydrolase
LAALVDCGGGVRLQRGVPCRMSDGVVLVADHYYPPEWAAGGRETWPTLLMRQPYGRDIASTVVYAHPVWFARHGYNVVIQDVRGRGDSEGEFYPFRYEGRDGAETIAAVRARPESNGKVGMYGFSYQGMTQWLAAAEQPEGLVCIAPAMTAHDLYAGWFYETGALRLASTLGWGLQMLKADARRLGLREASERLERAWANLPAQYLETPYAGHMAIQDAALPSYVRDWLEQDAPGEYWAAMDVSTRVAKIRVPALHVSGWYDTYLTGSVDGYRAMRAGAGSAEARDGQYLLAGPWVHIPWGDRIGGVALGAEANLDTDALHLRWFNHWLKGTAEFAEEPRVRHFAMDFSNSEARWHGAEEWPDAASLTLYLHSDGRANSSKGDGRLSDAKPDADEAPDVFVYDPEVPVMAPGGAASASGPLNQAAMELMHVFGTPEVEVWFASSAASADVVAKLVCARPNGDSVFVGTGVARSGRMFAKYAADTARLWKFALAPTSCVFGVGDRVRLEIASSAYPLFDRNPSTEVAARLADSWNWGRSTQTVYHDKAQPSCLRLPVVREGE